MNIYLNKKKYNIKNKLKFNYTIFQVCNDLNIDIPNFCFHEKLNIAGNCRMCLVEVVSNKNLVVSCSNSIFKDINIYTSTKRVFKAQEDILEFLLINHPLDCPICDQGGECDLQDIVLIFGSDKGRFFEDYKKVFLDKNFGPFIKTVMSRCILCLRCVRFNKEFNFTNNNFSVFGRGSKMEISTYLNKNFYNEIIGNIIDLCPVGALTSKPYSFKKRPWETLFLESFDIFDTLASNIKYEFDYDNIYRVLPIIDKYTNDWITDRIRFSYDSYFVQRFTFKPQFFYYSTYFYIEWTLAFKFLFNLIFLHKNKKFSFFLNQNMDIKSQLFIKNFFLKIGIQNKKFKYIFFLDFRNNFFLDLNFFFYYLKNFTCFVIFFYCNFKIELPLLFSKLRRFFYLNKKIFLYYFGNPVSDFLNIPFSYANNLKNIYSFNNGKKNLNLFFNNFFFFLGNLFFKNQLIFKIFFLIKNDFLLKNKFNFVNNINVNLFKFSSFLGLLNKYEINLNSTIFIKPDLITSYDNLFYLFGTDNLTLNYYKFFDSFFFDENFFKYFNSIKNIYIFQGSHNTYFDFNFKLILPSTAYLESDNWTLDLTGKFKHSKKLFNTYLYLNKKIFNDIKIIDFFYYYKIFKNIYNYSYIFNFSFFLNYYFDIFFFLNTKKILYFYKHNNIFINNIFINNIFINNIFINNIFDNNYNNYFLSNKFFQLSKNMINGSIFFFNDKKKYKFN